MTPKTSAAPILICEVDQFGGAERALLALSRWLDAHGTPNYPLPYVDRADFATYAQHPMDVVELKPALGVRNNIEALRRSLPGLLHRESGVSDILMNTPWATVFDGDETALTPARVLAINSVMKGSQVNVPGPCVPTEDEWAEQVAGYCGYIAQEATCR